MFSLITLPSYINGHILTFFFFCGGINQDLIIGFVYNLKCLLLFFLCVPLCFKRSFSTDDEGIWYCFFFLLSLFFLVGMVSLSNWASFPPLWNGANFLNFFQAATFVFFFFFFFTGFVRFSLGSGNVYDDDGYIPPLESWRRASLSSNQPTKTTQKQEQGKTKLMRKKAKRKRRRREPYDYNSKTIIYFFAFLPTKTHTLILIIIIFTCSIREKKKKDLKKMTNKKKIIIEEKNKWINKLIVD